MKKEECALLSFYAISPIHAGSGASVATVDLPIQRERHTGYPHIQASGVKGAMRDHFRKFFQNNVEIEKDDESLSDLEYLINKIFGSDEQDGWNKENIPGLISVSDAKLLAFPMRSNISPFVWVTCLTILKRLKNDLEFIGQSLDIKDNDLNIEKDSAIPIIGNFNNVKEIILEDAVVKLLEQSFHTDFISQNFPDIERLILISDEMFDYCISSCTEIQTNIKIDSKTGTTQDGSLRYQEFLPSDSVLYSIIYFGSNLNDIQATQVKNYIQDTIKEFIQIGGDSTLGKGICKIKWINGGQ